MFRKLIFAILLLSGAESFGQNFDIVPKPVSVTPGNGRFVISGKTRICSGKDLEAPAMLFVSQMEKLTGTELSFSDIPSKGSIKLQTDLAMDAEEYVLNVSKKSVSVTGGSEAGVYYGLQSLLQLAINNDGAIPAVMITDKPYMAYRGAMMDVSRHFFSVDEVKRFIDILALHKLNRFHWHLTDDQGWRIEIKKYPLLTSIGSIRKETLVGQMDESREMKYDGIPYGGYYTQDQIREIVDYAAKRYIEVIPEIELPGHGVAALTAYPWLGCTGGPYEVWTRWGISKDVFCAGKESTFEFIENVLTEVLELFPSKYIHIGGDECPKDRWEKCPLCQKRMKDEGLENEKELQSYFMQRIEKWMHSHGREIIGWDEIMDGGISKTAIIMAWRDQFNGTKAAQQGNRVIMTPKWNCYLDYSQTSDPDKYEPIGPRRYLSIRQAYRLDPYDRLTPEEQHNILGVQANVWAEYIPDFQYHQKKVLPRLAALSEVGWAYDRKNYDDFVKRLASFARLYDKEGLVYSDYVFKGIE